MNKGMKRKMKRVENKKKKIAAFLEVAKLNENDRKVSKMKSKGEKTETTLDVPAPKRAKDDSLLLDNAATSILHEEVNKDHGGAYPDLSDPNPSYIAKDIDELKRMLRERKKKLMQIPRFSLKESGELASLYMTEDQRIPLFMADVQHLIMWSLLGHHAPFAPSRWYSLCKFNRLSHTVVLAVDGISVNDLQSADGFLRLPAHPRDDEPNVSGSVPEKYFPWKLEFIGPLSYGSNLVQEISAVPLSNTQYDKVMKTYGSIEKALKRKAVYRVFRSIFPVQDEGKSEHVSALKNGSLVTERDESKTSIKDKFPRTELLLSAEQMVHIGYPMPLVKTSLDGTKQPLVVPNEIKETEVKIAGSVGALIQTSKFRKNLNHDQLQEECSSSDESDLASQEEDKDDVENESDDELYMFTKSLYKEVGPNSPMFGVDCEMCLTGKNKSELTRISVVNENLEVVYETLVKPHRKITNYLTRFSGITEKMLRGVKTRLKDVQKNIRNLLPPDAILVGQSLNFDLHAMKMMHPYVIDTSIIYNLSGDRSRRTKLATLSRLFLSENIQCAGPKGHDPVEDATAAMKLVLLKLSKSIHYGDAILSDRMARQAAKKVSSRQKRLARDLEIGENGEKGYATSIFSHMNRGKHAAAVIGVKGAVKEYKTYVSQEELVNGNVDCSQSEGKPPNLLGFEHSSEAITCACEIMLEHQLCVVHITKDSVGEKLKTLKRWCKKIVKYSAPCSLCVVVLGGTENMNGACFIHLKGPTDEIT